LACSLENNVRRWRGYLADDGWSGKWWWCFDGDSDPARGGVASAAGREENKETENTCSKNKQQPDSRTLLRKSTSKKTADSKWGLNNINFNFTSILPPYFIRGGVG
jgi:hypothetical protein